MEGHNHQNKTNKQINKQIIKMLFHQIWKRKENTCVSVYLFIYLFMCSIIFKRWLWSSIHYCISLVWLFLRWLFLLFLPANIPNFFFLTAWLSPSTLKELIEKEMDINLEVKYRKLWVCPTDLIRTDCFKNQNREKMSLLLPKSSDWWASWIFKDMTDGK